MDLWEQVILEWVNCLDILKNPIKDIQELHNVNFYKELINKLPQEDYKDVLTEDNIILSFIKAKYPEFEINFHEKHEKLEELLIASLLLLHTAHEPTFHRPMCLKLQHETQVKIKSFLEMILPYEKNVTKQVLLDAITELDDASPKDLSTTPKTKPLREFFNSPAARSAHSHRIMTERIREIRQLKSELETERFEKMDLQEDIRIQQSKIQKLEKKLEERTAELKALRAEQMRSRTPQSCKKGSDGLHSEGFYKREIEQLENELLRSQSLAERYDEEKNNLMKRMSVIEKQYIDVKEKYKLCEKSLEMATVQLELKDRELGDLRTNNEELRTHLKEISRVPVEEPSFEGESLLRPRSPIPMGNISESLSSVIDIQFQEAKEESASLRIELNSLNSTLQALSTDYQKVLTQNQILQEKSEILETVQEDLQSVQNELLSTREKSKIFEDEKKIAENECQKLRNLLASQEVLLTQVQHSKEHLDTEIKKLNETVKEMEASLLVESNKTSELQQNLVQISTDYETYKRNTESSLNQIINHGYGFLNKVVNSDDSMHAEPLQSINKMLFDYEETYQEKEKEIGKLNTELSSIQSELSSAKERINALEDLKLSMLNECKDLKILLTKKETDFAEAEHCKSILYKQIEDLNDTVCRLEKTLLVETDEKLKLTQVFEEEQAKRVDTIKSIEANLRSLLQNNMELIDNNIIIEDVQLQTLLKHLESVVHDLGSTRDIQKAEIESSKEAIAIAESTIAELNMQISDLKEKHELAVKEINQLSDNASELDLIITDLKHSLSDSSHEISRLKEVEVQKHKMEKDIENLQKYVTDRDTELETLKTHVKVVEDSHAVLEKQLETNKQQHNIQRSYDDKRYKELKEIMACEYEKLNKCFLELQSSKKELESIIDKQTKDMLIIQNVNVHLEEKLSMCDQMIKDLEEKLSISQQKLEQSMLDANNLQDYNKNLKREYKVSTDQMKSSITDLQAENTKLSADLKSANEMKEKMSQKYEELNTQFIEMQSCKQELESTMNEIKKELSVVQSEKDSLVEQLRVSKEEINDLESKSCKLQESVIESKSCKQELESALNEREKEISVVQSEKDSLVEQLRVSKEVINDLETKSSLLQESVHESKKTIQDLNNSKDALERMHTETVTELNLVITNTQTENTELSTNIESINVKYGLLQEQMSNVSKELGLRIGEIDALRLEVQNLQAEKERMINLHKNTDSKTKELVETLEKQLLEKQHSWEQLNIEVKLKEETLAALQSKMEDLTKEKIASELKMKEVILNLQEVRVNQDAVLTAQAKALNEKCSQLEEIQRELNEMKELFSKQLETEKSLRTELQVQNSTLTDEIGKYVKNIEELREDIKQKAIELCKKQEYSEAMDIKQSKILLTLEELKHSIVQLRTLIIEICPNQNEMSNINTESHNTDLDNDGKVNNILSIIQTSVSEINILKLGISHLQGIYKDLQESLSKQGEIIQKTEETNDRIQLLTQTVQNLETEKQSFNECMQYLLRDRELLKEDFSEIMLSRENVETALNVLKEKWCTAFNKFKHIFITDSSMCDELKHLQVKKDELEKTLHAYEMLHLENMRPLTKMLWQTFLWTEEKLENMHMRFVKTEQNEVNIKRESENDFSEEKKIIELELKNNLTTYKNILECEKEVEIFASLASNYENNVNAGQIKKEPRPEEKLKLQIDQLTKEKRDLKLKLDNMRVRNAKLEKNMDDLRAELKKIKAENSSNEISAFEDMNKKVKQLEEDISRLQKENEELSKRPKEEDFDNRLKEVHSKYELTLEEMKQKMKTAYNEQVAKINKQQERTVQEKMDEMKQLCRKHAEEIKRYKEHVGHLSKQLWSVGENLLIAQKEKEDATQLLHEWKAKLHNTKQESDEQKMVSTHSRNRAAGNEDPLPDHLPRQSVRSAESIHEDRMYERRSSMRSMQAMGNAFNAEDEEGEVFDSRYLADMKEGKCSAPTHLDRLSVLKMRNSLCKPHLKSSYPAETQFHPLGFTEEDIKNHSNMLQTGSVTDDVFNDSLTQSLLAEQKPKKRDRTQTSYKKPGPPTPSKNGGRLSLQGNEIRSPNSRILRDRNVERRTTITPRRLKDIFSNSSSKRQDENSGTPKGRRLSSIFRKPRTATERF